MASKDLELTNEGQIEQAIAAIVDGQELAIPSDPDAVSRMILERLLRMETADELFRPQTIDAWRDHLDRPAEVHSFHFNRSSFEQGEGQSGSSVYAIVDLTWLDDGERQAVTCGGRNVMVQLVQALRHNLLPVRVRLIANRTSEGYQALWLEAV